MKIVETADVFLTNFRPGARKKLRIDVDDVRAHNDRIIYVRGSAAGQRGEESERGGYDMTSFWARSGAADNVSVVTRLTLMQLQTPDDIRGRVAAVNSIFIGASNQLGEFESGSVAALWGPVVSVVSGGVGTMLIAVTWLKLFPTLASRDRMQ